MKKSFVLLACLLGHAAFAQARTELPIDAKASALTWTGHAEVGSYAPSGTLTVQSGSLTLAGDQLAVASLHIDMRSLHQDNASLTEHLKSPDFFDVERYPTAEVIIAKVEAGTAYGSLTLRGKSASFQAPVHVSADGKHFLITGSVTLDRTKFGIVYNSTNFFSGLGDKAIRNTFEVTFKLVGTGDLPARYRRN